MRCSGCKRKGAVATRALTQWPWATGTTGSCPSPTTTPLPPDRPLPRLRKRPPSVRHTKTTFMFTPAEKILKFCNGSNFENIETNLTVYSKVFCSYYDNFFRNLCKVSIATPCFSVWLFHFLFFGFVGLYD